MLSPTTQEVFLQNPLAYELDLTHPLTPNYGFYLFQNDRVYNFAKNDELETGSSHISYGSDERGFYVKYDGSIYTYVRVPSTTATGQYWQVSILASQTFVNDSTEQAILCLTDSSSNRLLQFYVDYYASQLRLTGWAGSDRSTATGSIISGQNYTLGMVAEAFASGTNTTQLYIDGSLEVDDNSSYSHFEDAVRIYLGNTSTSDAKGANGPQYWVYFHVGLRTPAEMASLSNNINQLFKPRNQVFHGAILAAAFSPYWVDNNFLTGGGISA